jgi:hypothetical protein
MVTRDLYVKEYVKLYEGLSMLIMIMRCSIVGASVQYMRF